MAEEPLIAVFVDYENLAIGARHMRKGQFKIDLVVRRLLEKGRIVFKRAYCDWGKYRNVVREFHKHGIELVDIPQSKASGKNSADIHMVVDALDLCYQKQHIDIFALISGDSDFSPLVAKLKENDKRVIGCGIKSSTSDLLIGGCDEFIYYDDLVRQAEKPNAHPIQEGRRRPHGGGRGEGAPDRALPRARLRHRLGLDGQAGHAARLPRFQRGILRPRELRRPARGPAREGSPRDRLRREARQLRRALTAPGLARSRLPRRSAIGISKP